MLRIYDYECQACGVYEDFGDSETDRVKICPTCGAEAQRIISIGNSAYLGNQDAPWLRSVLDVVDRESKKPHVRAFVQNPTRENYRKWMKGEGIRPVDYTEHGGPPAYRKPEPAIDTKKLARELFEKHRARNAIEVRS